MHSNRFSKCGRSDAVVGSAVKSFSKGEAASGIRCTTETNQQQRSAVGSTSQPATAGFARCSRPNVAVVGRPFLKAVENRLVTVTAPLAHRDAVLGGLLLKPSG